MPRCVVVDQSFDWEDDALPRRPWAETVIYETHVKGFTECHPDVREDLRGTYASRVVAAPAGGRRTRTRSRRTTCLAGSGRRVIYATVRMNLPGEPCYDSGMFASGSPGVILSESQGEIFF